MAGFLVAKTFVDLVENIGLDGTFWLYGSICFIGAVCTLIFVPETRNKSFEEIQAHFTTKPSKLQDHETGHPLETVS